MDAIRLSDAEYLTDLVERVEAGESIDITRDGKPVARLVPVDPALEQDRSPVDVAALRSLAAALPFDPVDSIGMLRDQSRY